MSVCDEKVTKLFLACGKIILAGGKSILTGQVGQLFCQGGNYFGSGDDVVMVVVMTMMIEPGEQA